MVVQSLVPEPLDACPPAGSNGIDVINPATGARVGTVPNCGITETNAAIEAAAGAFATWRKMPAQERAALLLRWHASILGRKAELARLLTAEQGKAVAEAEAEIEYAACFIAWFAAEAVRIEGREISSPNPDRRILVREEPIGVCAAITPWNFPAAMVTRKLAPALAAGCTVVVKPSELTPLTALALARLAREAGMPAGCINVVTGEAGPIGAALTASPTIRKLSFTGSTTVGRQLMAQCAPTVKRLSLELGGNAPFIVFDDADCDQAIAGLLANKFRNAGQTCVCANRIFVQSRIHDRFVDLLAQKVSALKVGDGSDATTSIGPLISPAAADNVRAHVDDAVALGAHIAAQAPAPSSRSEYVCPTVLTGVSGAMRVSQEETFGPVVAVQRFDQESEAVALANDTLHGLAAYFYTTNANRAWRVAEALECGMVGLNTGAVSIEAAPFGGVKQSGFGREGGREGIKEYLATKTLHWAGLD
jgi:succinate-semialdehyde dehydrogenase/glutarate-semialdehyde dehydrogenase